MSVELIKKLMGEQSRLNTIIDADWIDNRSVYDFCVAISVEANECIDHCGYKWWKKSEPDIKQAQMEVVDCWFFYLSCVMVSDEPEIDELFEYLSRELNMMSPFNKESVIRACMDLTNNVTDDKPDMFYIGEWLCNLTNNIDLSFDELYDMYMGKLLLNIFRQTNGYNKGTYIKTWFDEEDNVHLHKIMAKTKDTDIIVQELTSIYNQVLAELN